MRLARCFNCRFVNPRNTGTKASTSSSFVVAIADPSLAPAA